MPDIYVYGIYKYISLNPVKGSFVSKDSYQPKLVFKQGTVSVAFNLV